MKSKYHKREIKDPRTTIKFDRVTKSHDTLGQTPSINVDLKEKEINKEQTIIKRGWFECHY